LHTPFLVADVGALCKTGFLPGCELVFKTLSTNGRDYHSEMNSVIFNKWIEEQLVPALPHKSLFISIYFCIFKTKSMQSFPKFIF
jgi:hypothetical protein